MNRRGFLLTAPGLIRSGTAACSSDRQSGLNVFNWSTCIDPKTLELFERERAVRIGCGTYEIAGVDSETLPMVVYATARRGVSPALNAVVSRRLRES